MSQATEVDTLPSAEKMQGKAMALSHPFAASIIALTGSDYNAFTAWLRTPLATIMMVLLLIASR